MSNRFAQAIVLLTAAGGNIPVSIRTGSYEIPKGATIPVKK
jgi:hypothetical protein